MQEAAQQMTALGSDSDLKDVRVMSALLHHGTFIRSFGTVEKGHKETHAVQQNRVVSKLVVSRGAAAISRKIDQVVEGTA